MADFWPTRLTILGVKAVWGSSNRNALSGLRGLKRVLDTGKVATITPDGPRGPARKAAMGPVALAQLTGKPILPVAWAVDRYSAGAWLGRYDHSKAFQSRCAGDGRFARRAGKRRS